MISLQVVAVAPVVSSIAAPTGGATNVKPNAAGVTFTITLNQNVLPGAAGAGVIALSNAADVQLDPIQIAGVTNTNITTGSTAVIDGNKIIVTFKTALTEKATYYITATSDAVMNAAGEYWAGLRSIPPAAPGGTHDYVFTVGDYTPPTVLTTAGNKLPADDATAVAIAQIYRITFSENIQPGTGLIQTGDVASKPGNIGLYKENGDMVELFDATTATATTTPAEGAVGIVGTSLYINPTDAKLAELGKYYIRILNTAIVDLNAAPLVDNKNVYAGINDNTTWNFQLADLTAPTFVATPANNATDIQQGQVMKMTFSDNRTAAGLSFLLRDVTAVGPPVTTAALAVGANVQTMVSFEEDPAGGAAFVAVPPANYTATYTAANEITIAFTGVNKFKTGAKYRLDVIANQLADIEGNIMVSAPSVFTAGDFTVPFTTAVYAEPGGLNPGGHAANFSANSTVADKETTKVYFGVQTSDVDPTSGLAKLPTTINYIVTTSATVPSVAAVKAGTVLPRITGQNFKHQDYITTDNTGATLASNTLYRIYYVITDNATVNNTSAVLTALVTTNDIVAPVPTAKVNTLTANNVTVASGAAATADVKMDSPVTITFDENVIAATANITVKYQNPVTLAWATLADGPDYTFAFNGTNTITITGAHADIVTYAGALWKSKGNYQVIIDNNEITDDLTGKFGTVNPLSVKTYSFTVEDFEGPAVTFNPANASTNFNNNGDIVITFSETPYYLGAPVTNANVDNIIELRKGDGVTATTASVLEPRTVSISGNVVTIVPTNKPLDSEIFYRAAVSTDVTDVYGYKLNMYKGNAVVTGGLEYSVFKTKDNRTPLVSYTTYDPAVDPLPLAVNGARTSQGLVSVVNTSMPVILLDESVREIASNTNIVNLDPNQIRTLITLKKTDANGPDVEFNVVHAQMNTSLVPPAAGKFEIVLDPIDYPAAFTFDNAATYYVSISGIEDAADNAITSNSTFTIRDITPLTISSLVPANAATAVAKSGNVVITFNQTIRKETTSGTFFITIDANGAAPWDFQIDVTNIAVTVSGNQVTVPYAGLASNTAYGLQIAAGSFIALGNNATNAISNTTFTTVDEIGPTTDFGLIANLSDDETTANSVKISGDRLTVLFDENIVLGYGVIKLRKPEAAGATLIADINVQSSAVTVNSANKKLVQIDLPGVLAYNSSYFLEIPQTAFKDAAGNNFTWTDTDHGKVVATAADITAPAPIPVPYVLGSATWDFQTELDAAPAYTTFVPAAGSNDVGLTAGLTINFSEPVSLATAGIRELTIYRALGNTVYGGGAINLATASLTWNSATSVSLSHPDFEADTDYYICISAGAFVDATGNAVPALGTLGVGSPWNFTTKDQTAPTFTVATSSGAALTKVGLTDDLIVTFSEPIVLLAANWNAAFNTSTGTLAGGFTSATLAADKKTLTLNPATNFASLAVANLTLNAGAVRDMATAGFNNNALQTVVLTGEDKTAPVWAGGTPAVVTPAYSKSKVKFNVALDEKSTVYYMTTLVGALTTNPTAATVKTNASYSYDATPFVPNAVKAIEITGLAEYQGYDVYVMAEDLFGNQTTVTKLTLYTRDETAPTVFSLYPANGAVDVNYNHVTPAFNGINLKIRFTEKVQLSANAARLVVRRYDNNLSVFEADRTGGLAGTLAITSSSGALQDQVSVTVPLAVLADKTQYYVEFEYDMAYDAKNGTLPGGFATANNVYADAFIGKADWSFTTADETAPVLAAVAPATTLVPADNATGIAVAPATMTMRFSEPIAKGTGIIYIYRVGNATPQEIINVTSSDVVVNPANNKELLITRHNTFASEVDYYVQFPATGVSDLAPVPNYYAGIANTTDWNFKTADITAPEVVWSIANNATNVALATPVTMNFKDPRQTELTGGNVFEPLFNNATALANATDIKSYVSVTANGAAAAVTSAVYTTAAPATVTVNITGGLKANTTYVVSFNPPANYKDDAGNLVPASTVTFTTVDSASPVITYSPVQDATNVPLNSAVTITFNKTIYNFNDGIAGVNHINFTPTANELKLADYITFNDLTVPGAVTYNVTVVEPGKVYQLAPVGGLTSSHQYEVIWNANQATAPAGQLVYDRLYVNNNILNIADAYPATGSGVGNKVKFTAEDKAAPIVTAQNPVNVAPPAALTIVNPSSNIVLTFNERVVAGAGNIQIRRGNGQIFHEVAATACTYSTTAPWTVTIPHPAFEIFTSYYVIIPEGAITDNSSNKNAFAGYADNTKWAFKTDDGTAPYVMSYSPVNGATDIPVFSNLSIKFSENINPIAGKNIVIYYKNFVDPNTGDGNAIEVIDITSAKVVISGSDIPKGLTSDIVTIDPATTFDKLGTFYIRIDAGAVQDFAATPNNYAGISNNTTWAFTITDNTKPALASVSPVNGTTGVGSMPTLTMTFDRNVLAGTGSVRIYEYFYNPLTFAFEEKLHEAIPASSSQVTGTGSAVVTITPSIALGDNKVYYVLVDNTAFTNTASSLDPYVGISNPFAWRFTTGDNTVPTVAANPVSGTTGLANTFDVTLTFSEPVVGAIAGITATGATTAVVTEVTAGTVYKVAVTAADLSTVTITAATTITDAAGNALAATMFTYGVADNNGPTLTVDPVSGSNIATNMFNVTLTFNEDVTGVDAAVTVDKGTVAVTGSGKVYTAAIDAPSSSAVVLSVANTVKDLADNAFAGATFTYNVSGDVTAPVLTDKTPTGTLASSHPNALEMTFDEDVVAGAGKIYIYRGATAEWSFDVTASNVTIAAKKVTVALATGLDKNATYFVYVDNGFVTDAYGNKFAGVSTPTAWTFTTGGFPTGNDPVIGSLEFKVYPNPFVNELKVDNASALSRIIITSMTGQKVKEIVKPTSTIQTNELRSGVYFITLYVDDVAAKTERIVKR
jgi:hypothetical protein